MNDRKTWWIVNSYVLIQGFQSAECIASINKSITTHCLETTDTNILEVANMCMFVFTFFIFTEETQELPDRKEASNRGWSSRYNPFDGCHALTASPFGFCAVVPPFIVSGSGLKQCQPVHPRWKANTQALKIEKLLHLFIHQSFPVCLTEPLQELWHISVNRGTSGSWGKA